MFDPLLFEDFNFLKSEVSRLHKVKLTLCAGTKNGLIHIVKVSQFLLKVKVEKLRKDSWIALQKLCQFHDFIDPDFKKLCRHADTSCNSDAPKTNFLEARSLRRSFICWQRSFRGQPVRHSRGAPRPKSAVPVGHQQAARKAGTVYKSSSDTESSVFTGVGLCPAKRSYQMARHNCSAVSPSHYSR